MRVFVARGCAGILRKAKQHSPPTSLIKRSRTRSGTFGQAPRGREGVLDRTFPYMLERSVQLDRTVHYAFRNVRSSLIERSRTRTRPFGPVRDGLLSRVAIPSGAIGTGGTVPAHRKEGCGPGVGVGRVWAGCGCGCGPFWHLPYFCAIPDPEKADSKIFSDCREYPGTAAEEVFVTTGPPAAPRSLQSGDLPEKIRECRKYSEARAE